MSFCWVAVPGGRVKAPAAAAAAAAVVVVDAAESLVLVIHSA